MPVKCAALIGFLVVCLHSQPSPGSTRSLIVDGIDIVDGVNIVDGIDRDAAGVYVRMRNQSYKDLVGYSLTIGDRFASFQVSSTPVIAAHRASRVRIRNAPDLQTAGNPGAGRLLIRAALFADGSYEGDPAAAAALVI